MLARAQPRAGEATMYRGTWAWVTRARDTGELEMLHGRKYPQAKFGANKWSGPGGGLEANESLERCIQRETQEELDITPDMATTRKVAIVTYHASGEPYYEMHCFHVTDFVGIPRPTREMVEVRWFTLAEFPFAETFEDSERLYRRFLKLTPFRANVYYRTRIGGLILPIEFMPFSP